MTQPAPKHSIKSLFWVILIFLPFIALILPKILNPPQKLGIEVRIQIKLKSIHTAILKYLNKNGQYPSAENWQDLLLPQISDNNDVFTLPSKDEKKNTIALNPSAKPDSPKDIVLLFESTGGWNAHGQSELLAPTSNGKPGYYVVFNDGSIEFISSDQIKDLNWGNNHLGK
jgi:hypothetical protein